MIGNSQQRTCDIKLFLWRYRGEHTSCCGNGGAKGEFSVAGLIDDYRERDPWSGEGGHSPFHYKPALVTISSPPDAGWLAYLAANLSAENALGFVEVKARVEPLQSDFTPPHKWDFEWRGHAQHTQQEEPVWVRASVDPDTFEKLRRHVSDADEQRRILLAKVTLVVGTFPDKPFLRLNDLDVSEDRKYAIDAFEVADTNYFDQWRGRVVPIYTDTAGTRLRVALWETTYEASAKDGIRRDIACNGRVVEYGSKKGEKSFEGASVSIRFMKHDSSDFDLLPKYAFAGKFYCYSIGLNPHFSIDLRYPSERENDLLMPILAPQSGTRVMLDIDLTKMDTELAAVTEMQGGKRGVQRVEGDVQDYRFNVMRTLINYENIRSRIDQARQKLSTSEAERREGLSPAPVQSGRASFGVFRGSMQQSARPKLGDAGDLGGNGPADKGVPESSFLHIRGRLLLGLITDGELEVLSSSQLWGLERALDGDMQEI